MKKNVTLSAEDHLIEAARLKARSKRTTLNDEFRDWIAGYVGSGQEKAERYDQMIKRLTQVDAGRKFTRDEMNERR